MLSSTIDEGGGGDVHKVTKRFLKKIDGCIATCFKRRRGGKKNSLVTTSCMKREGS